MPASEFSEDEYEQNLILELRDKHGHRLPHFKPSRVVEHGLGFDFAINTNYGRLASSGVYLDDVLLPIQAQATIPRRYVSSFVQCKVPFKVTTAKGKEWAYWSRPYFKFDIDADQNDVLAKLEGSLNGTALVRYATPCYHTFIESEKAVVTSLVADLSHYVSPSGLIRHLTYTYEKPTQVGIACSEPAKVPPSPIVPAIASSLFERPEEPLVIHLLRLQRAIRPLYLELNLALPIDEVANASRAILGQLADVGLDPFNNLRFYLDEFPEETRRGWTVGDYVALVLELTVLLRRMPATRSILWRIFYRL